MLYPTWLNPGDNAWQMTAATLVGLMSVPGLVVLYGGVMQKRWSVNSMMLAFIAFALVLVMWVLYGYNMGFGHPVHFGGSDSGFFNNLVGKPGAVLSAHDLQGQGEIPLIGKVDFPQSSLVYFQLVFAAITPILMLGSVLGRVNFKAWIPFVVLWSTCVYTVNAFLIWGGGWFAQQGAVDFSGGYVIHLAAGVSGFVAAWVIGPRLARDREIDAPNNLAMVAIGAGLLWLGWNGFNGGDPYNAGADASSAVLNTNVCHGGRVPRVGRLRLRHQAQAVADRQRQRHDRRARRDHARGRFRDRLGGDRDRCDRLGRRVRRVQLPRTASTVPQRGRHARRRLHPRVRRPPRRPADRSARRARRWTSPRASRSAVAGTCSSGRRLTALWVIVFSGVGTFILLKLVGLVIPLRMSEEDMEMGDLAVHGHEVYPSDIPSLGFPSGIPAAVAAGPVASGAGAPPA